MAEKMASGTGTIQKPPFNSSTAIKLAGPHKRLTNITYRSAIPSCHEMI